MPRLGARTAPVFGGLLETGLRGIMENKMEIAGIIYMYICIYALYRQYRYSSIIWVRRSGV